MWGRRLETQVGRNMHHGYARSKQKAAADEQSGRPSGRARAAPGRDTVIPSRVAATPGCVD